MNEHEMVSVPTPDGDVEGREGTIIRGEEGDLWYARDGGFSRTLNERVIPYGLYSEFTVVGHPDDMQPCTCGDETDWDGDSFVCYTCGLNYGDGKDGTPASYIDPFARRCGRPCGQKWHKVLVQISTCGTCVLPNGHGHGCYTDCRVVPATSAEGAQA